MGDWFEIHLAETTVQEIFNSHLRQNFYSIQWKAGDIKSELAMSCISITEVALKSYSHKVVGLSW